MQGEMQEFAAYVESLRSALIRLKSREPVRPRQSLRRVYEKKITNNLLFLLLFFATTRSECSENDQLQSSSVSPA